MSDLNPNLFRVVGLVVAAIFSAAAWIEWRRTRRGR